MAALNSLPEELLDRIITLCPADDSVTLPNLCLVSRKFQRITEPHLYENIESKLYSNGLIPRTNLPHLLRSLSGRPSLAEYENPDMITRFLLLEFSLTWYTHRHPSTFKVSNVLSFKTDWKAITSDQLLPIFLDIINLAPKLQVLHMPDFFHDLRQFDDFVISITSLTNLKELDLNLWLKSANHDGGHASIFSLYPILSKLKIEVLRLHEGTTNPLHSTRGHERIEAWKRLQLPVKHLLLDRIFRVARDLLPIFANSCTELQSLHIQGFDIGSERYFADMIRAFQQPIRSGTVRTVKLGARFNHDVFQIVAEKDLSIDSTPWPLRSTMSHVFILRDRIERPNSRFASALRMIETFFRVGRSHSESRIAMGLYLCAEVVELLPMLVSVIITTGSVQNGADDVLKALTYDYSVKLDYKAP